MSATFITVVFANGDSFLLSFLPHASTRVDCEEELSLLLHLFMYLLDDFYLRGLTDTVI